MTQTSLNENIPAARISTIQKTISSANSKKNCWKGEFKKSKNRTRFYKILKTKEHSIFKIKNAKIIIRELLQLVNSKSTSKNKVWRFLKVSQNRLVLGGTIPAIVEESTCSKAALLTLAIMKCHILILKNHLQRSRVNIRNKRNSTLQARKIWRGREDS